LVTVPLSDLRALAAPQEEATLVALEKLGPIEIAFLMEQRSMRGVVRVQRIP
jgi:hypothetical protein